MSNEEQLDELQVLESIYEGDTCFHKISDTVFQYRFGSEGESKSFFLQISWPAEYPTSAPILSLDLFYNKHVISSVKKSILTSLSQEIDSNLGMAMTFTLIEHVKENLDSLLTSQPDALVKVDTQEDENSDSDSSENENGPKEKKVALSKAQKRKLWDRGEATTEKSRGYNWVDIVKHLSQTGYQKG